MIEHFIRCLICEVLINLRNNQFNLKFLLLRKQFEQITKPTVKIDLDNNFEADCI